MTELKRRQWFLRGRQQQGKRDGVAVLSHKACCLIIHSLVPCKCITLIKKNRKDPLS